MFKKNKNDENDQDTLTDAAVSAAMKKKDQRFGVIKTSIFHYITPIMLLVAAMISGIVGMNISTLALYFNTSIYLNGLIIFLLSFAMFNAFYNNFLMYRTAKFLKDVQNVSEKDEVDPQEIENLHIRMVRKAYYLDTQNMHDVIQAIEQFGTLIFTDNDSRLIKHKMGYRIRLKKSGVGFLAGILVMLGLLGTFLGLLKTIDAVGLAMAAMSDLGGDNVTGEQMTNFISGLSAPLQGMGLAFSSSLFGLSGSLMIGFFNHLCGGAQDAFIENVGRWIDDRIPKFDPKKKKGEKAAKAADNDDLKTWLAGYVYLSVKTNKRIASLTHKMMQSVVAFKKNDEILLRIEKAQGQSIESFENVGQIISQSFEKSHQSNARVSESINGFIAHSAEKNQLLLESVSLINNNVSRIFESMQNSSAQWGQDIARLQSEIVSPLNALKDQLSAGRVESNNVSNDLLGALNAIPSRITEVMVQNNQAQSSGVDKNGMMINTLSSSIHEELLKISAVLIDMRNQGGQGAHARAATPSYTETQGAGVKAAIASEIAADRLNETQSNKAKDTMSHLLDEMDETMSEIEDDSEALLSQLLDLDELEEDDDDILLSEQEEEIENDDKTK